MSGKKQSKPGKRYSLAFKQEVVEQYKNGTPVSDLCTQYEITEHLLYDWIDQLIAGKTQNSKGSLSKEQQEILELKKQIKALTKKARDYEDTIYILKKAEEILSGKKPTLTEK